jgi:hypothetical protein
MTKPRVRAKFDEARRPPPPGRLPLPHASRRIMFAGNEYIELLDPRASRRCSQVLVRRHPGLSLIGIVLTIMGSAVELPIRGARTINR